MSKAKPPVPAIRSSVAEYLTFIAAASVEGGVHVVYEDEDVWISQKMMSTLYEVNVRTVNEHLKKIFTDNELQEDAVIRKFRITASDGKKATKRFFALVQNKLHWAIHEQTAAEMVCARVPMTMTDWEERLNRFIAATDRKILQDAGKVTAEIAKAYAISEFEKYRIVQDQLYESDFDKTIKALQKKEGDI
jgi:hypothetical protein